VFVDPDSLESCEQQVRISSKEAKFDLLKFIVTQVTKPLLEGRSAVGISKPPRLRSR
jgi:hypothetical protein